MKLIIANSLLRSVGLKRFCIECPKMKLELRGAVMMMLCGLDGDPIQKHVDELNCGLGNFGGIGDYVKRFFVRTRIELLYNLLHRNPHNSQTCTPCEARQRMLNSRWGGLFRWLDDLSWRSLTYCPCNAAKGS